jgi:peptidoglycan/LPS O-acetylase OafA/YrhL
MPTTTLPSKPHYPILDGLRGVAALLVVAFHLFEAHATSHLNQVINHGYLAVDFFFLLSGFVIGYAYDDRWSQLTLGNFFTRRLVRLQPMVVMGTLIGAACFYFQASPLYPPISTTSGWLLLLMTVLGSLMVPVPPALDVRGWNETYPLNGPAWSLFYEYIVNILYALVVRKFPNWALGILVFLAAVALVHLGVTSPQGDVIGGWSLDATQLHVGFSRVMYPFFAGLLLFRVARLKRVNNAFLWCSLLVLAALAMPRVGGSERLWLNGLYDSLSIIFVFPLIIFLAASGELTAPYEKKLCRLLGDISYPIYITHYPLIYLYTAWVHDKRIPAGWGFPVAAAVFVVAVLVAYACLKLYDEPVRRRLAKVLLPTSRQPQPEKAPLAG